jgi:hypothetical protein
MCHNLFSFTMTPLLVQHPKSRDLLDTCSDGRGSLAENKPIIARDYSDGFYLFLCLVHLVLAKTVLRL